jgi:hypothetical protein
MNLLPALRAVMVLHLAAALFQSVTAGMLLSSADGRALHVASGLTLAGIGAAHVLLSILVWRPGRGSAAFIPGAVLLLAVTAITAMLGQTGMKVLHLPLGVAIFGGTVAQLLRAMPGRTPAAVWR